MIDTPDEVQKAIQIGVLSLERSYLSDPDLSPLTRKAFHHQTTIGWSAFLRGRISKYWRAGYAGQDDLDSSHKTSFKWVGQLVVRILTYSQHLWVFWCGVIHGHTKEEGKQKHRDELIQQIQSAYEEYYRDPHVIPNSWRYLFNRPQPSLTCSDRDTMTCWLKSFSKARQNSFGIQKHPRLQHPLRPFRPLRQIHLVPYRQSLLTMTHMTRVISSLY